MHNFIRNLKGEFMKVKRGKVILLHILLSIPIMIGIICYGETRGYTHLGRISLFIELFALGVPFAVGLVVNRVMKIEYDAGGYKGILKNESGRICSITSKLAMLIILGIGAFVVVLSIFFLWELIAHNMEIDTWRYFKILGIFCGGIVVQYIMAVIVTMKWGQTGGVIFAGIGSLIGALMVTGLGDEIWLYIPFGWIPRMQRGILLHRNMGGEFLIIGIITVAVFSYLLLWISRWEGTNSMD